MTPGLLGNPAWFLNEARETLQTAYSQWKHGENLISIRENAVFRVTDETGRNAALRLHRPGYQNRSAIRSELRWTGFLSSRGLSAPSPIPTDEGRCVATTPNGLNASLVTWVPGISFAEILNEHQSTIAKQSPSLNLKRRYWQIGREIARIHNETDAMVLPPGFVRPAWDVAGFVGKAPLWGRFWEHSELTTRQSALMREAREIVRTNLEEFRIQGADFGLIHADPIPDNILFDRHSAAIIDYDDSGFGFRMYDLAVALYDRSHTQPNHCLADSLCAGYRSCRLLPESHWKRLPLFLLLRSLACLGWIEPRKDLNDGVARSRRYLRAAVRSFLDFSDVHQR